MGSITISLNGERHEVPEAIRLDGLLELFALPSQRVAIELNGDVIRKAEWPDRTLNDEDTLEIVHFVGGG